jgi:drug/metabolite transporter (DMT)-like permease
VLFVSEFRPVTKNALLAAAYIGVFETGLTYVLWLKAMKWSNDNSRIGNLVFFAPFLSLVFVHFILKEKIFITTFLGLIFLVLGLLVQQYGKNRKKV